MLGAAGSIQFMFRAGIALHAHVPNASSSYRYACTNVVQVKPSPAGPIAGNSLTLLSVPYAPQNKRSYITVITSRHMRCDAMCECASERGNESAENARVRRPTAGARAELCRAACGCSIAPGAVRCVQMDVRGAGRVWFLSVVTVSAVGPAAFVLWWRLLV